MDHMELTQQDLRINTILVLTEQGSEGNKNRGKEKNQDRATAVRKTYTLKISIIVSSSKGKITKRNNDPVYGKSADKVRNDVLTDTQHQPDFFLQTSGTRKVLIKKNIY